jgi:DNA replication protein DnaC
VSTEVVGLCQRCDGTGWVVEERDGRQVCRPCACQLERRREELVREAAIPERFRHCTLESFQLWNPHDPSLAQAKRRTQEFVEAWPLVQKGLLFMGPCGTGKTHLAVAALAELVRRKGVRGFYVNFLDLVVQLQMSFDGTGPSRGEILEPVLTAELVVLDELGAARPTPWVMDLLYYVLNTRYLGKRITVCTTNYTDVANRERGEETLADRLSAPVRSRLYEMCEEVRLYGEDYRQHMAKRRR